MKQGESVMFDIEQSLGFALSKANQRIAAVFEEELKTYRITPRQFILLTILWKKEGVSQVELSRKTGVDRATLVGIIDRMEEAGLLERRPCPKDRRVHRVWLTERGRGFEEDLVNAADRVRERIVQRISPGEYMQLRQLLSRLRS